jgi:hypothetical protein
MYTARKKIQKDKGLEPSEFEDSVAQVRRPVPPDIAAAAASPLVVSRRSYRSGAETIIRVFCRRSSTLRMGTRSSRATSGTSTSIQPCKRPSGFILVWFGVTWSGR